MCLFRQGEFHKTTSSAFNHGGNNGRFRRGFSLSEILIALALFGMLFVCLIQIIIAGHFAIRQGDELIAATNAARLVIERTRELNFSEIPVSATFLGETQQMDSKYFPPKPYPSFESNDITYTVDVMTSTTTVSDIDATFPLRRINVTIWWESKNPFSYGQGGSMGTHKRSVSISNIILDW